LTLPTRLSRTSCTALATVTLVGLLVQGCSGTDAATPGPSPTPTLAPAALLERALSENASGDGAAAKKDFEALLAQDPANKLAAYNLGVLAQQAGDEAGAAAKYTRTLEIDPSYEPALYNFAILTNKQGDQKGAAALYERAVIADPKDANAHYNLGLLLLRLGDPARGAAQVDQAIGLDPTLTRPTALSSPKG
jgi:Tfp pilus assembly protein PilF